MNCNVMDSNIMNQLEAELAHAGEATALSPRMLMLEQMRITPGRQLRPMEFLFRLFGRPCFPRRELVAITGRAKSGKTFVTSMLMTCCTLRDVLYFHREGEERLRVLWYDTEQSDESTLDILKNRVMRMVRGDPGFDIFNVRGVEWKERRAMLGEAVAHCRPDLVIVDGIRDLVNDINDGVLAQEVMEELMHMATEHNCCIVCVLHQNKGSEDHNLRGWIGTELTNKAFEVYTCEKLMPQRVFTLMQTMTRKYDIEQTMFYEVGADGLPATTEAPVGGGAAITASAERLPHLNPEYVLPSNDGQDNWQFDVLRLFTDAMRGQAEVNATELRLRVMQLSGLCSWKLYGSVLSKAVEQRIIVKGTKNGRIVYTAAPF